MSNNIRLPPIENIFSPLPFTTTTTTTTIASVNDDNTSAISKPRTKNKKRQRKKFEDVKRLYYCDHPNCNKGYGSLTHLNEHRVIQKHGPRKKIDDFKHIKQLELQEKKQKQQQRQQQQQQMQYEQPLVVLQRPSPPTMIKLPLLNLVNAMPIPSTSLSNYHYPSVTEDQEQLTSNKEPRFYQHDQFGTGKNGLSSTFTTHISNSHISNNKAEQDTQDNRKKMQDSSSTDIVILSLLKMKNER